jgi:serine phosphatase RsbU (regulator of sigma subunit)
MGLKQKIDELAARFSERPDPGAHSAAASAPKALREDYWRSVQELFTRDVTSRDLRDLLQREPRETLRFFTREIDFQALRPEPWYRRYPKAAFKVFQAMAYRLSPARRLLFAISVPVVLVGWLNAVLSRLGGRGPLAQLSGFEWVLGAATLLLFLLVLELRDKLALKGDLEVARQIQFGLLPFEPYRDRGVRVATFMRPANTVGGDYFDLIEREEGGLSVVLGDVAGKGMPAALLMALLQGSLRTLLTAGLRGSDLVAKLNAHLHANIPSNRLITLFYGEVDGEAGRLRYVNAGHNPPVLIRSDGAFEALAPTAVALGVLPHSSFEIMETEIGRGDRLVVYTDGITEATNPRDEEYGEVRLEAFLRGHQSLQERALIDGLIADVLAFADGVRPRDDMTVLLLGRDA